MEIESTIVQVGGRAKREEELDWKSEGFINVHRLREKCAYTLR